MELNNYDLKELITLEYNGKTVKPESEPVLIRHHNYGDLTFNVGDEDMESFIMKIDNLPNIDVRVFEW